MTAPARSTEALPAFDGLTAIVSVEDEAWRDSGLDDLEPLVLRCIRAAARVAEIPPDTVSELSVTFADDAAVQALNGAWRGKDKPTNVLSFPMLNLVPGDRPGPMLGDVILARETVAAEAAAEGKSLHDHLCHLIVHGFMHCLGFDHVDPEDADEMEGLEIDILSDLGIADPYAAAGTPIDDTERTASRR